jgi:hypothetical protein
MPAANFDRNLALISYPYEKSSLYHRVSFFCLQDIGLGIEKSVLPCGSSAAIIGMFFDIHGLRKK